MNSEKPARKPYIATTGRRIVIPGVAGSIPVSHPNNFKHLE